jgi:hypothetical protein
VAIHCNAHASADGVVRYGLHLTPELAARQRAGAARANATRALERAEHEPSPRVQRAERAMRHTEACSSRAHQLSLNASLGLLWAETASLEEMREYAEAEG